MAWAITAVLGLWMTLSVANQIAPGSMRRILRHDAFALVPNWRFFSPIPKKSDTLVMARAWRGGSDEPDEWTMVSTPLSFRPWSFLFHPMSRVQKATADLSMFLLTQVGDLHGDERRAHTVIAALPYAILLSHAAKELQGGRERGAAPIRKVQFAIVDAFGDMAEPRTMFMSEAHDL